MKERISFKLLIFIISFLPINVIASDWQHYGGDAGGKRYSSLQQITPENVDELAIVWQYRSGELGEGYKSGQKLTFEATPVLWNRSLYISTAFNKIMAIDAATGKERWRYDAQIPKDLSYAEVASRGVSLWHSNEPDEESCNHRVFVGTLSGELHALDAETGKACSAFGNNGKVDLTRDIRFTEAGEYTITSPPVIYGDLIIIGSAIGDNRGVELERGIVRAIDARSGLTVWAWDPIPTSQSDPEYHSWQKGSAERNGGANAWAPLSIDVENGLVFIPTSSPSPDFYGGERKGDNRYANSLVALNAENGQVSWHYQLVHHDVWDYDVASQPVLFNFNQGGQQIAAVVQSSKSGMLFVFNRLTGEPLIPIEERTVPQGGVAGEALSPTQPFSTLPSLVSNTKLEADDAWGMLYFDTRGCRKVIESWRSDGIYTPPTLGGSIMYPGNAGGSNWGGVSVDEKRQIVIANVMQLPFLVKLIEREQAKELYKNGEFEDFSWSRMDGTPYMMIRKPFLSMLDVPCVSPPWGKLVAMDLKTRKIAWDVPLGTIEDLAPAFVPNLELGVPGMGGPISTASGLVFIAAATDDYLRAFDTSSGKELWKGRLPAGGQATPMSYEIDGRQFVVIAAGGHGGMGTKQGDYVVAFALSD